MRVVDPVLRACVNHVKLKGEDVRARGGRRDGGEGAEQAGRQTEPS